ncbi:CPBP family intramembrane glutamic endopeptidase [Halegenticoccus soli]|uniref:CPBP family intramembrane glutamic endopeptidase n=1 Tax=Halegenticoccus soli TaxID=1985678 RepID=UPI000C6D3B7D|nr:CPBP family intramembrane glutamic endopeptidase [Halegenticoccus soli]
MKPLVTLGGLALALALGGMPIAGRLHDRLRPTDLPASRDLLEGDLLKWAVAGGVVAYTLFVERLPLSSLSGRSLSPSAFVAAVCGGTALLVSASAVASPAFDRLGVGRTDEGLSPFSELSTGRRLFVVATAGVTEELAFRGYAVERLVAVTGSPALAGGASFAAFTAAHASGRSRDEVLRVSVPALVTTLLYLRLRNLPALICVHALNDALGLLLLERADESAPGDPFGSLGNPFESLREPFGANGSRRPETSE